ncbi:MAG: hypothetical protein NWP80_01440, partial [Candidatus Gracilibacteria bacterium]|nr:hypothetical protein [Candidatus Gracilibacteria bacterium]
MIEIFGLKLSKLSYKDFFGSLVKFDKQNIIFTPNPEIMLNYMKDEEFKNILLKADYLLPDGIGLYLGAMILEEKNIFLRVLKLPYFIFKLFIGKKQLFEKYGDKICGSDLTKDLLDYSDKNNIKITIIDLYNPLDLNKIESQKSFRKNIEKIYKNLDFDYFFYDLSKKDKIIEEIKNSNSKILFSTLG